MKKQRLGWLDTAKGIGILLVVAAHCMHINRMPFQLIYTFYMPLFFVLSGYVFNERQSFTDIVTKKTKTLLLPYGLFFMLGLIATLMIPVWRRSLTLTGIKNDLWLADPNAVHNSSIWFLVCMFFVQILYWIICRFPQYLRSLLCLALYVLGILYSRSKFEFMGYARLPLDLDVVPVAILFFDTGYLMKKYRIHERLINSALKCTLISGAGTVGLFLCYKQNGYVNLHGLNFGNPVIHYISGILGTAAVVGISGLFEFFQSAAGIKVKKALQFFGRNTLIILGVQSLLIRVIILICGYMGIQLQLYHMSMRYTAVCGTVTTGICTIICAAWEWRKRGKRIDE